MKERGITLNPHYLQGDSAEHFTFYGLGWDQEVEQFKVYLMCHNFTAIPKVREKETRGGEGEEGGTGGVERRGGRMERRRDGEKGELREGEMERWGYGEKKRQRACERWKDGEKKRQRYRI